MTAHRRLFRGESSERRTYYMLDGRPVPTGAILEVLTSTGWLRGTIHYDCDARDPPTFAVDLASDRSARRGWTVRFMLPESTAVRWPEDEVGRALEHGAN